MKDHRRVSLAVVLAIAALWLTAGCATSTTSSGAVATAVAANAAAVNVPVPEYRIQPTDTLQIKFYYHPDHDQEVVVRNDGKIVLPLIGEIDAAGRPPADLAADIAKAYSVSLREPKVDVFVKTMNERQIYVGGEVNKPGFLPYREGLTALQASLASGGFKDSGDVAQVMVLKRVANGYEATKIDLTKALEEGDPNADRPLGPTDVVFVPKTGIAKAGQWVQEHILNIIPFRPVLGATLPLL
jgi:protein involved in polysaccharide export with SLBB domain